MKVIAGLYSSYSEANEVVRDLVDAGFSRDMISLVASNAKGDIVAHTGTGDDAAGGFSEHRPENYAEGDAVTGGQGAGFGAVVGTLVALGALLIPGIGPIVAAGPLAVALGAGIGAAAGAVTGGITAGLVKTGISEEDAEYYAEGIRSGGTLVSIEVADDDADDARRVMEAHAPSDLNETGDTQSAGFDQTADASTVAPIADARRDYGTGSSNSASIDTPIAYDSTSTTADTSRTPAVAGEEGRFQVVEEDLNVGKRQVQSGGVRVYSTISERPVEEQVRLRSERVVIERHPVNEAVDPSAFNNLQQGAVEVTEYSEEAVVSKTARVVEEVTVGKQVEEHVETVHDSVRRTDVAVEQLGGNSDYSTYATNFRTDFDTNYASGGYSYDEYEPAYRYGWDLGRDTNYASSDWSGVESQLRSDWETRYPNNSWDRFGAAIKNAWNQARGNR